MTCKECNQNFITVRQLSTHLKSVHGYTDTKVYYDKFFKAPDDGVCVICGKPTKYVSLAQGYYKCCNNCKFVKSLQTRLKMKNDKERTK